MSVQIKICGLTRNEDIDAVNMYRPDYIGFVFARSKRQITPKRASELRHRLDKEIKAVGVFVNEDRNRIAELCENKIIDIVQLHGSENEDDINWIKTHCNTPVIKAVSVKSVEDIRKWENSSADYLLLDNGAGGTGKCFDWNVIECDKPFFLAGGINRDNIKKALLSGASAIDISGGVETDGLKDAAKIKEIIDIIRRN